MNKELTHLALYVMFGGVFACGIWFIIDTNMIMQVVGLSLVAISLGGLFSTIAEQIVKELKQPNSREVKE